MMDTLEAQTPAGRRAELDQKMCALGQLVGLEWARDNAVRKINTRHVSQFYRILNGSEGDAFARLASVETQARALLAR
jgi:hypothetical protein